MVLRGHCDAGACHDPWGCQSLQWPLPGEQRSEEAAASLEAAATLGDCGQCSAEHSTMPEKQEANAHGQPREGQPLLYRRRHQVTPRQPQAAPQVTWTTITAIPGGRPTLSLRPIRSRSPTWSCTRRGSQYGGHSVPRSSVTGPQRLSVSDLPPLHGPPLTLAPPHQLSGQSSRAATDCVKLPPLPVAAASGSSPRGTARAVGAAWDSVKLPPLPAAPAAATASGSSPGGTARAAGPTARGQPEHREELEKVEEEKMYTELFEDIFSSMGNEESPMASSCDLRDPSSATLEPAADPSVPHSTCSLTEEATGEAQNYSELVSPELLADLGSDSEDSPSLETLLNELLEKREQEKASEEWDRELESPLSIPPRDEELEPAPTPPDSDLSDQGHSEPLPRALPGDPKGFGVCASPADAAEEARKALWG
nr:uncharacterized protein LOC121469278 [Taeniopygia guttata]